jgi:hypothetical protein
MVKSVILCVNDEKSILDSLEDQLLFEKYVERVNRMGNVGSQLYG